MEEFPGTADCRLLTAEWGRRIADCRLGRDERLTNVPLPARFYRGNGTIMKVRGSPIGVNVSPDSVPSVAR
jgi:hypothetical protein